MSDELPRAESGALILGDFPDPLKTLIGQRWPNVELYQLGPTFWRADTSKAPGGVAPGFDDARTLAELSRGGPQAVIGFFCDAEAGLEGARVYEEGREALRERVSWAQPPIPDSVTWPISKVAQMLRVPVEFVTRVPRPSRPPLTLALEALHQEQPVEDAALRRQALDVLGHTGDELAEQILLRFLESEDWVDRTHAVRAYVRQRRPFGEAGRPTVDTLMDDPDESVREALFEGLKELIAAVEFSDQVAHDQIDAAIRRGLADEDEDVQAAAAEAQELRKSLLG